MAEKPDWAEIERAYEETDLSLRKLGKRFGIGRDAIGHRARRDGWKVNAARWKALAKTERLRAGQRRLRALTGGPAAVRQRGTADQLHRLVRRLAHEVERRLDGVSDDASGLNARESMAQMLNALTRAVSGLAALERRRSPGQGRAASGQARGERNGNMQGAENGGGGGLGADAAWDEVERRLARLAAEGGAGAVPERPAAERAGGAAESVAVLGAAGPVGAGGGVDDVADARRARGRQDARRRGMD